MMVFGIICLVKKSLGRNTDHRGDCRSLLCNLSVVIVTWNGDDILKNCLDSLVGVYGSSLEIVVVDNADSASTHALVSGYAGIKYIPSPGNPGFAGGNNIGVRETTRPYILLLNNDTVVHGDSFSLLVEFLSAHERVGIVQGTMNIPSLGNSLDDCGVLMTPFGIQRHLHRGEPSASTVLRPQKVFAAGVHTVVLFFRKGRETKKPINYYQLDLKGVSLGKTRPLNEDDLAEFEKLAKGGNDKTAAHWTIDPKSVNQDTFDLSVVNPNIEEEKLPSSAECKAKIKSLYAEIGEIIKGM